MWDFTFFINSALLGVGLAMDAFSVSLVSGMSEKCMKRRKMLGISATFATFQAVMPLIGWICVHTIVSIFSSLTVAIPYIALALLTFIGVKTIIDGCRDGDECECKPIGLGAIFIQGIATSIDALSVGFTIATYDIFMALTCALIIAVITFAICLLGVYIGKKFGSALSNKASIFGGIILIIIGLEIFITSFF